MSLLPEQLVFDLAHRSALDAEDFLVSRSNESAVAVVDSWPVWPHWAIVVTGPAGSGKSHLVNVWRGRSKAEVIPASGLCDAVVGRFASTEALAVEDLDRGIGDERVLFHLLNLAREHRLTLLLTSRGAPGELTIALPDLRSRIRALPHVAIDPPDQPLLAALLVKLFADRQLPVEPHVIEYLLLHMERSTEAAAALVAEIDRHALAHRRKVTRVLAAEVIKRLARQDGRG